MTEPAAVKGARTDEADGAVEKQPCFWFACICAMAMRTKGCGHDAIDYGNRPVRDNLGREAF